MSLSKKAIIDGMFKLYDIFNVYRLGEGVETQDLKRYYKMVNYTMYSMLIIMLLAYPVILITDSEIIRAICLAPWFIPSIVQFYYRKGR